MENVTEELVRQNGNQAAAVMADYAGQGGGGGGSVPKFSDFVILEPLTPEEIESWEAANVSTAISRECSKLNKKVLEKLACFVPDDGTYGLMLVNNILELDDAGNILAITTNYNYLAKNSSLWESDGIVVPDSASDDYFYRVVFSGPK